MEEIFSSEKKDLLILFKINNKKNINDIYIIVLKNDISNHFYIKKIFKNFKKF